MLGVKEKGVESEKEEEKNQSNRKKSNTTLEKIKKNKEK